MCDDDFSGAVAEAWTDPNYRTFRDQNGKLWKSIDGLVWTEVKETMPASLYVEPHWFTGRPKVRCSECGKVAFPDQVTAEQRAKLISVRQPMRAYKGQCGHWHVARRK